MAALCMFLLALGFALMAGVALARKAGVWGIMDPPGERKVHQDPTPRTGGLAMAAAAVLATLVGCALGAFTPPVAPWPTWFAGGGFLLTGALDDRFTYRPGPKFLVMLALAVLAAWPWVQASQAPGFTGVQVGPWLLAPRAPLAWALLTLWFLAVPNVTNIEDAINGYIGGFTLILLAVLAVRGLNAWILLGALAGFLVLNWPRAIHFMGDAGSFGCGFILAEGILHGGGFQDPLFALLLTAPLSLDVAMGLVRRRRQGISLFTPDQGTLPHHLLRFFKGSTILATSLLWANALAFLVLSAHPALAGCYTLAFIGILILFNRPHLARGTGN